VGGVAALALKAREVLTPQAVLEADWERAAAIKAGTTPIAQVVNRRRYRLSGVIRAVALGQLGVGPGFTIDLFDGTGVIEVVWLGQRQVRGLEPGRHLIVEGLAVVSDDGSRLMRNPRYELVPLGVKA
jgi:hypothetical protein